MFSIPPGEPRGAVFLVSDPVPYTGHLHVVPGARGLCTLSPAPGPESHVLVCKEGLVEHYMEQVADGYAHVAFAPQRRGKKLELVPGVTVASAGQVCMLYFPVEVIQYLNTDMAWPIQLLAWHVETLCRRLTPVSRHESELRVPNMHYSIPRRDCLVFNGAGGLVVGDNSGADKLYVRNTVPECTFSHVVPGQGEEMVTRMKQWPNVCILVVGATAGRETWVQENIDRVEYPFLDKKLMVPGTHATVMEALADAGGSVVVEMSPDFWYPAHSVAMRVAALELHWDEGIRMVGCPYLNCVSGSECFQSEDLYDRCENIMLFPGTRAYRRGFTDHPVSHSVSMDPGLVGVCVSYAGPVREETRTAWGGFERAEAVVLPEVDQ